MSSGADATVDFWFYMVLVMLGDIRKRLDPFSHFFHSLISDFDIKLSALNQSVFASHTWVVLDGKLTS